MRMTTVAGAVKHEYSMWWCIWWSHEKVFWFFEFFYLAFFRFLIQWRSRLMSKFQKSCRNVQFTVDKINWTKWEANKHSNFQFYSENYCRNWNANNTINSKQITLNNPKRLTTASQFALIPQYLIPTTTVRRVGTAEISR